MEGQAAFTYAVNDDTICALATPAGTAAIAVIRMSGKDTFSIVDRFFHPVKKIKSVSEVATHRLLFGTIRDAQDELLDEVLVSVFKNPHSYTGEDAVEISCHGSMFIQQQLLELLMNNGARLAEPGEFTMRAFSNGKFDLAQAEAVADLISSHSKTSHDIAMNQMRGGYSSKMKELREQLLNFASLIELELDFSEEDVEFANREELDKLLRKIKTEITSLIQSFSVGNVLKKGIPVTIVGEPNVGKSTLLNALLNEEKAIVSEIPGTTRDVVEDSISIEGVTFRFIDTAGLRESSDKVESMGIERTYEQIRQARIVLYVFDIKNTGCEEIQEKLKEFEEVIEDPNKKFILVANKTDQLSETPHAFQKMVELDCVFISAKRKENLKLVSDHLLKAVDTASIKDETIVSNARHYHELQKALEAINSVGEAFEQGIPSDLIAIDIRTALHHLGEITGEITTDEILGNIFGKFCIGK